MNRREKQISANDKVVIAVEGLDYLYLLLSQIKDRNEFAGVLLWNCHGDQFAKDFALLVNERGFKKSVKSLGIVRDAEDNRNERERSIKNELLRKHDLPQPTDQMTIARDQDRPSAGYLIMPHDEESGCLEHACLKACALPKDQVACAEKYLECLQAHREKPIGVNLRAKTMVHALIASHHGSPAMTLGESGQAGIWDFGHDSLKVMLDFIQQMRAAAGLQ